jgi:nucleotide-binding universal stress UspA family protein
MKILLAVDGSKYTKKMLAYLATHPELFSADHEYSVFTAQVPLPSRAGAVVGADALKNFHVEEAERILAPVCKFLARHGIDAKSSWKVGAAGTSIGKFADAGKYDLLVLGSHGHGALVNLVMGSVATQVLAHCKTPVLLVR